MELYYDCHMHELHNECGGFLIALDGLRGSEGGYDNKEVIAKAKTKKGSIAVQYVTWELNDTNTSIIKYHPRREKYSPHTVRNDLIKRNPKGVIIDTLNQPDWQPQDYWLLAKEFPNIPFLFSHAGGFDMLQFLNMAMFQENVWIDFSFVQNIFGLCGDSTPLKSIIELMEYGLKEKKIYKKLLFGTDNMRGEMDVSPKLLKIYKKFESFHHVVNDNFLQFKETVGV